MGRVENYELEEVYLLKTNPNDLGRSHDSLVSIKKMSFIYFFWGGVQYVLEHQEQTLYLEKRLGNLLCLFCKECANCF